MKVLQEKWWQWGKRAAVWAAYLLTPSRGGATPQHPHKSLASVRERVRGNDKGQEEGREIKDSQGQWVNLHKCSWRKWARVLLLYLHTFSERWCVQRDEGSSVSLPPVLHTGSPSCCCLPQYPEVMSWVRNSAPPQLLHSITALRMRLFSNQVCAHHPLPKSPEAVSACLGEDRPEDFALPALGDAQAHATFDRIQRCFSVCNKHSQFWQ